MPPHASRVYSVLRRPRPPLGNPPLCAAPRLRHRHLRPEALAPLGLCCPGPPRLPASSASQENFAPFPGTAGYRHALCHSLDPPVCPPHLPGFYCCTVQDCRLQYAGSPAACTSVLPHRHWPSGTSETLGSSNHPANQLRAGKSFRRFIRSLSLRPSCLLAPRADQTGATFRPHRPPRAFTSGLSGHRVSGRALARAPLGGGFPSLPFRLQSGFSVPPSATFPAAPPKDRTSGFPTVRLQASGTLQFGTELSAGPPRLRLTRPCPRSVPAFSPSFDAHARR